MKTVLVVLGTAAGLLLLDRLLLGMERKGWIYWRKRRGSSGSLGTAMLEAQALLEPSKRHIVEERRSDGAVQDENGDRPESGGGR